MDLSPAYSALDWKFNTSEYQVGVGIPAPLEIIAERHMGL
jgi:hypothetical protein